MQDLNDLYLFAAVVAHHGFSPAARALRVPKSKLSKHVARLEERLGVRLLERSTRKLRVTDIGQEFYEKCEAILAGVEAAEAIVAQARAEPKGLVRLACPPGLAQPMLAEILPGFLARFPLVRVEVLAINRRVDLIEERVDVALRVRARLDTDPSLTVRQLGHSRGVLVASPDLAAAAGDLTIERLASWPTLSQAEQVSRDTWHLVAADGRVAEIVHEPRLACGDFGVLKRAAGAGLGIALLPQHVVDADLRAGTLVGILPEWTTPEGLVHLVFTTRRGLLPAVGALIDHLGREFPPMIRACHRQA